MQNIKDRVKLKMNEVENELRQDKELIKLTAGGEDGEEDEGSDSMPSEDNLDVQELALIVSEQEESPANLKSQSKSDLRISQSAKKPSRHGSVSRINSQKLKKYK